jgi:predicted amidohydrolase
MATVRIALANIPFPSTPDESVTLAEQAIADAGRERADIICFPETFVPGYRVFGRSIPRPDEAFLERAWKTIAEAAANANVAVVLGTERVVDNGLRITALVINGDGVASRYKGQ